jgi:hypothetical protein
MSFHQVRNVKLRKPRKCTGCFSQMNKGQEVVKMVGKHYDFYSSYICFECSEFMSNHLELCVDDEGLWYEGDIGDAREEFNKSNLL